MWLPLAILMAAIPVVRRRSSSGQLVGKGQEGERGRNVQGPSLPYWRQKPSPMSLGGEGW